MSVFCSCVCLPAQIYLIYSFCMTHKKVSGFLQWLNEIRDPRQTGIWNPQIRNMRSQLEINWQYSGISKQFALDLNHESVPWAQSADSCILQMNECHSIPEVFSKTVFFKMGTFQEQPLDLLQLLLFPLILQLPDLLCSCVLIGYNRQSFEVFEGTATSQKNILQSSFFLFC